VGVDQRRTGQGGGLDGDPHHHDVIGKGHHGHGGQKQQHGAGEDVFGMNLRFGQIRCGVDGDHEKEQRNHQQRKQSLRGDAEIVRKGGAGPEGPDQNGNQQVQGSGDTSSGRLDLPPRKKAIIAGKKGSR
jgi:hypothetical protein